MNGSPQNRTILGYVDVFLVVVSLVLAVVAAAEGKLGLLALFLVGVLAFAGRFFFNRTRTRAP